MVGLLIAACLLVPAVVFPRSLVSDSQRMDGDRPCHGLDQHENYSPVWSSILSSDSHWDLQAMAGKRSYGPAFETRPR